MRLFGLVLLLCTNAAMAAPSQAPLPLKDFARLDSYRDATISPDGNYLALLVPIGTQLGLAVIELASRKVVAKISAGEDRSVSQYVWAGSRRLVASLAEQFDVLDYAQPTGELFAVDIDGRNSTYLFGFRGVTQLGWHAKSVPARRASGQILRSLPDDPEHVVIEIKSWAENEDESFAIVNRLNVRDGVLDQEVRAPVTGAATFSVDRKGFVRSAIIQHQPKRFWTYTRTPEQPEWKPVKADEVGAASASSIGSSNDASTIYLSSDEGGEFQCLIRLDIVSGARTKLACDAATDLVRALFSFGGDPTPIAAVFDAGIPTITWLDTDKSSRALVEDLQKAFPGQRAWPVSSTGNGEQAVIEVSSDRNPGDYYLLETRTHKASYLLSKFDWIDPERMAERRPVEFAARDGQRLHAIMTLPLGPDARQQPLVVLVHGGPFGIRDTWDWDDESQMLASRGYTVLQVNFRGSGGYGRKFVDAGRRGWDHTMIDDVTDGTRWAIAQGYADPQRICIFGASYGGYAALMSAVREPELYRCTIGYAGIYDLARWKHDSDVGESKFGRAYIADFVGADAASLRKASPITYIDRLKAAVMIVHGVLDSRAPYSQAMLLRDALDQRDYPYEWLTRNGEGHGFFAPKNRLALYEQVIAFLDKNIGPQGPPVTVAAPPARPTIEPASNATDTPK